MTSTSSKFFTDLTMEQVVSTYKLVLLLRRLRVTGTLELETVGAVHEAFESIGNYDFVDMRNNIYGIEKIGYDPTKGKTDVEELLENIFGRKGTNYRGTP